MQSLATLLADLDSWRDRIDPLLDRWEPVPGEIVDEGLRLLEAAADHPDLRAAAGHAARALTTTDLWMLTPREQLRHSLDSLSRATVELQERLFRPVPERQLVGRREVAVFRLRDSSR